MVSLCLAAPPLTWAEEASGADSLVGELASGGQDGVAQSGDASGPNGQGVVVLSDDDSVSSGQGGVAPSGDDSSSNSQGDALSSADDSSTDDNDTVALTSEDSNGLALASENGADTLHNGDDIWVNGTKGSDNNAGTEAMPVKTFARAKELMAQYGSKTIWVSGALSVRDAETWDLGGKSMMRAKDYHGQLAILSGKADLTLTNIVIDGNTAGGAYGTTLSDVLDGGSLVLVCGDSILTVAEGAKLQNNTVRCQGNWYAEAGGGVAVVNGTLNLKGGTISGNSAANGGGVCAMYSSTVNVYSGEISGNSAVETADSKGTVRGGGYGGGILVCCGADVNVSGGSISGNSAVEAGGGIAVGQIYIFAEGQSILTMSAGTIANNKAGSGGGGIFVQGGYTADYTEDEASYSVAYITGGDITGNAMTGTGTAGNSFGGGGIYVNGYSSACGDFHNGELYLENAEVSGNSAAIDGGGYAGCPVSRTKIDLTNGAVFYGNKTDEGTAREIYVLAASEEEYGTHGGDPEYAVTPSMLGGGAYRWVNDDGSEVELSKLSGTLSAEKNEELRLSNALDATDSGVQKALGLAKVHITGNTSVTRGGGIGSNGSLFIGESSETTEVHVSKVWDDLDNKDEARPTSVVVELYRDGEYVGYQTITPGADGNWETTFKDLPKADGEGDEYIYTVKERDVEGYTSEVSGDAASGFIVTNRRTVSVDVTKKWDDNNDADGKRPSSVTVDLLRDGVKVDSAEIAADENGSWAHTFASLAKYDPTDGHEYVYTVAEHEVEGYASVVTGSAADGFTITNTRTTNPPTPETPETPEKPEKPSKLPQTGDPNGTVVPVCLGVAALALAVGVFVKVRHRGEK